MTSAVSFPQVAKGIYILPKPVTPGGSPAPATMVMDSSTVLDSAKRLALSGFSPDTPGHPAAAPSSPDSSSKCKRKLHFSKVSLPPGSKHGNPKTVEKRNARERNRVKTINETFVDLRDHLPCGNGIMQRKKQKKMSKVDILKGAIDYINMMKDIIDETDRLSSNPGSPASCPGTPGTPSYSTAQTPTSAIPAYMQPGYQRSPASPHSPSHITSSNHIPSSPHANYNNQYHQTFTYPSIPEGNFLSALSEVPAPSESTSSHQTLAINSGYLPSPGGSAESARSASPAAAAVTWLPDEDDIRQLASWFQ